MVSWKPPVNGSATPASPNGTAWSEVSLFGGAAQSPVVKMPAAYAGTYASVDTPLGPGSSPHVSYHRPTVWAAAHAMPPEAWSSVKSELEMPRHHLRSDPQAAATAISSPQLPLPPAALPPQRHRAHADARLLQDGQAGHADGLRNFATTGMAGSERRARPRVNSQHTFADRSQTVIVFDWDDTLFPTTFLLDEFGCDWQLPLCLQPLLSMTARQEISKKLAHCEDRALETLRRAYLLGHLVVVTLAKTGWVDRACRQFYQRVGDMLRTFNIPVVYALDKVTPLEMAQLQMRCRDDEEFYGLLKGRAISDELQRCYSQYEGQTWKNVLSIGDSRFERYGLLAASAAYMRGDRVVGLTMSTPESPEQRAAWERVDIDSVVRLRVKCCKLVERPDMEELSIELDMLARWMSMMVKLDEGFDLDVEALKDASQIALVEAVMRGERPVGHLPKRC